jgi:FKBP-type peptidyl-prolyl cis-trans isomerase FkpA
MRIRKIALYILCASIGFVACKKNDTPTTVVEERDRAEQQIVDNDSIIGYLETHYYNSSDFGASNPNPSINDLIISELPEDGILPDPDNNTLLIDAVETKTTVYADTDYEFYILKLNQGGGESPSFADKVRVNYEGRLLDETIFDNTVNPVTFDLLSLVRGWSKALPYFSTSESFTDVGDGTVEFYNYGVGVIFLPSGLGYYSNATTNIYSYSPLIFKIELYQMSQNDDDSDGVPSFMEDLNGDGDFTLDDDTDGDNIPDYVDTDDDGDGVLTINEDLEDTDLNVDSDGDGDPTNDKIGDGDPTNDDTDGDGIPNYLDPDDTQSNA